VIYLYTFFWCLPSPLLWVVNAEAWVVGHALSGVDFPIGLAMSAAISQTLTFSFLFFFGNVVLDRFPRLRARIEKVDVERHRASGYLLLGLAAILGFPPLVLLAVLGRPLHYRFPIFVAVCVVGRIARFTVLAMAPDTFRSIFGAGA
jgi:membrane protein YqaA with SNARE-associated domain